MATQPRKPFQKKWKSTMNMLAWVKCSHCLWFLLLTSLAPTLRAEPPVKTSPHQAFQFLQQEQWDQAIISYETMLATERENPMLHFNLGIAYYKTFRFSSAQQSFEQALHLRIDDPAFQAKAEYNIGIVLFEQAKLYEKVDEARCINYLNEAITAFENTTELSQSNQSAVTNTTRCKELLLQLTKKHLENENDPNQQPDPENNEEEQSSEDPPEDGKQESEEQSSKKSKDENSQRTPASQPTGNNAANPKQSESETPTTTDQVAGKPGEQQLDLQEALMLLDSIEIDEKRITLSELLETSEQTESPNHANW